MVRCRDRPPFCPCELQGAIDQLRGEGKVAGWTAYGSLAYDAAQMTISRKSSVVIIAGFCLLFAVARTGVLRLRYPDQTSRAVGDAPRMEYPSEGMSQLA